MRENARAEREGNRTAGTKRERNANKQLMGNGWMEWAGKKACKIDGNEGALMKKMRGMEGKGMDENVWTIDGKFLENALME